MDTLNKTISRDGKISKVDFRERLAPVKQEDLEEYIKSKGRKYTLLKLVEEMAELQKEILKDVNCGEKDKDAILEEIGDVLLHLTCAQQLYGFTGPQVHNRIAYKLIKRKTKQEAKQ